MKGLMSSWWQKKKSTTVGQDKIEMANKEKVNKMLSIAKLEKELFDGSVSLDFYGVLRLKDLIEDEKKQLRSINKRIERLEFKG